MSTIREKLASGDHQQYLQALEELPTLPRDEMVSMVWDVSQSNTALIQARMMNPLREFNPDLAAKLALQILDCTDSLFHFDALYSLWKTRNPIGISRASSMLLTHPDSIVRLWSACYLGECGAHEQIQYLQQALNDDGTDEEGRSVRSGAASAISAILERER